jgi:hypothetical protein
LTLSTVNNHFIAKCPYEIKDHQHKKERKEDKINHKKGNKNMGEAHIGNAWDSTIESSSEEDENVATIAINKHILHHGSSPTCPMMTTTPLIFVSWQRVRRYNQNQSQSSSSIS